ncbi:hypothetical protein [Roseibium marinum]|uniref:Uncharacterized protein n=1 Tax=Roseibium marinum TaxID=281252 RepID=A0A2S3UXE8_9HYPH|nr:hypothetical protein [Roseibium marinum]POF32354.1 hypothetical protein CLV41_103277 [Roseibium marinum]
MDAKLTPKPELMLQGSLRWVELDKLSLLRNRGDMKGGFVHFNKPYGGSCLERVYINLNESLRGRTFGGILLKIWELDGVLTAKVAVSGREAVDSVVVYCRNAATRDEVLRKVKKYQRHRLDRFGSALPKMVAQTGKPGIGFGAEPPRRQPFRPNSQTFNGANDVMQSFGLYRSSLIFIALERTFFRKK